MFVLLIFGKALTLKGFVVKIETKIWGSNFEDPTPLHLSGPHSRLMGANLKGQSSFASWPHIPPNYFGLFWQNASSQICIFGRRMFSQILPLHASPHPFGENMPRKILQKFLEKSSKCLNVQQSEPRTWICRLTDPRSMEVAASFVFQAAGQCRYANQSAMSTEPQKLNSWWVFSTAREANCWVRKTLSWCMISWLSVHGTPRKRGTSCQWPMRSSLCWRRGLLRRENQRTILDCAFAREFLAISTRLEGRSSKKTGGFPKLVSSNPIFRSFSTCIGLSRCSRLSRVVQLFLFYFSAYQKRHERKLPEGPERQPGTLNWSAAKTLHEMVVEATQNGKASTLYFLDIPCVPGLRQGRNMQKTWGNGRCAQDHLSFHGTCSLTTQWKTFSHGPSQNAGRRLPSRVRWCLSEGDSPTLVT